MDLKRLRYFCRVVEHGSVSQAAKSLNMAQPPLSKRIQELEEELQFHFSSAAATALNRRKRGISYIEKAVKFYARWRIPLGRRPILRKRPAWKYVLA